MFFYLIIDKCETLYFVLFFVTRSRVKINFYLPFIFWKMNPRIPMSHPVVEGGPRSLGLGPGVGKFSGRRLQPTAAAVPRSANTDYRNNLFARWCTSMLVLHRTVGASVKQARRAVSEPPLPWPGRGPAGGEAGLGKGGGGGLSLASRTAPHFYGIECEMRVRMAVTVRRQFIAPVASSPTSSSRLPSRRRALLRAARRAPPWPRAWLRRPGRPVAGGLSAPDSARALYDRHGHRSADSSRQPPSSAGRAAVRGAVALLIFPFFCSSKKGARELHRQVMPDGGTAECRTARTATARTATPLFLARPSPSCPDNRRSDYTGHRSAPRSGVAWRSAARAQTSGVVRIKTTPPPICPFGPEFSERPIQRSALCHRHARAKRVTGFYVRKLGHRLGARHTPSAWT